MHMETCIHYSTKNLLAVYKVCLYFYCHIAINNNLWYDFFNFHGFLSKVIYQALYMMFKVYICSAWFLDSRILTCLILE